MENTKQEVPLSVLDEAFLIEAPHVNKSFTDSFGLKGKNL